MPSVVTDAAMPRRTRTPPAVSQNRTRKPISNKLASMPASPDVRNLNPSWAASALNLPWADLKYR